MDETQPVSNAEGLEGQRAEPQAIQAPASPWKIVKYGTEHALQDMLIYTPARPTASTPPPNLWLVFIHGGGWRAPVQTRSDILPALAILSTDPRYARDVGRLAGVASVNYALSAGAEDTCLPEGRGYVHPRHLLDVCAGLRKLADLRGVGRDPALEWMIAGHSCGATMAFQLVMGLDVELRRDAGVVVPPVAVVGLEGLYDLSAAPYPEMFAMAFGPNPQEWKRLSPTRNAERLNAERKPWMKHIILGHSRGDSLVDWQQPVDMCEAVKPGVGSVELVELVGEHDEVWTGGLELARLLGHAIDRVVSGEMRSNV
jgi:acetyl esterase/lipase